MNNYFDEEIMSSKEQSKMVKNQTCPMCREDSKRLSKEHMVSYLCSSCNKIFTACIQDSSEIVHKGCYNEDMSS